MVMVATGAQVRLFRRCAERPVGVRWAAPIAYAGSVQAVAKRQAGVCVIAGIKSQVSSKARKRAPEQHRRGAQHHRGAPAHRARTHRRGGGQQAPTAGGQHRRAGGPQRGTTPRGAPAHKGAAPTRQQVPTRILCSSSDGDRERFSLDLPKKSETIRGTWSRNGN